MAEAPTTPTSSRRRRRRRPRPTQGAGSHRRRSESAGSAGAAQTFGRRWWTGCPQLSVTIVAGLALCVELSRRSAGGTLAFVAFALLAWVLTREPTTTAAGGFGYGFLFGLVFYLPLLPWISGLVGAVPWLLLGRHGGAVPRRCSGCSRCSVRRLPGWPLWFAGLWVGQEWLKSTVPFGGFPWGVVGFSQTDSPLLPLAQFGGAPLLSFAVALTGFSVTAIDSRGRALVAPRRRHPAPPRRPPSCCPACASALVLLRPRWRGRRSASPVWAPATTSSSPWPRCRATCRGSGWSSTPSAARCSTTTCAKRCGWPRTCGPAARRNRCWSSGRRTPPTSTRWPTRTPARRSPRPPRRSTRRSWSAAWSRHPATARTTRCRPTR